MSEPHPAPVSYYLFVIKDLQSFSELFPKKAKHLIKEIMEFNLKKPTDDKGVKRNLFFLPKRSDRFYLSENPHSYITTYEALCAQLAQQGKSYKEIGEILSMGSGTVKTYLTRLKTRTDLSLQEISLQLLHPYQVRKGIPSSKNSNQKHNKMS